jgi:hypothetical protein
MSLKVGSNFWFAKKYLMAVKNILKTVQSNVPKANKAIE